MFEEYKSEFQEFDIRQLRDFFEAKDKANEECQETLNKKWKQWRRLSKESYGVAQESFPKLTFASNKKGRTSHYPKCSKPEFEEMLCRLYENRIEDALIVHIMYECKLRPSEVEFLRFSDIIVEDKKPVINVYKPSLDNYEKKSVSVGLFKSLSQYKDSIPRKQKRIKVSPRGEPVVGYFMFNHTASAISKRFRNGFGRSLVKWKLKPDDIRLLSEEYGPLSRRFNKNSLII